MKAQGTYSPKMMPVKDGVDNSSFSYFMYSVVEIDYLEISFSFQVPSDRKFSRSYMRSLHAGTKKLIIGTSTRHPFSKACLQHSQTIIQPSMWFLHDGT